MYGEGISREGEIIDLGVEHGLMKISAWYSCGDIRLGQGKENARQFLKANPELFDELDRKLR